MGKGSKDKVEKAIEGTYKKYKTRMKRCCCCGSIWLPLGLALIAIGIVLLVFYAELWNDETRWERHLAYTGVAFMLIGIVCIAVGVFLCVILCLMWRRIEGTKQHQTFRCPAYGPGQAPYPQQPMEPSDKATGPLLPPQQPTAPEGGNVNDVNIEISEHHKF